MVSSQLSVMIVGSIKLKEKLLNKKMGQEEVLKALENQMIADIYELTDIITDCSKVSIFKALQKLAIHDEIIFFSFSIGKGERRFYVKSGIYNDLFRDEKQSRKTTRNARKGYREGWSVLNNLQ